MDEVDRKNAFPQTGSRFWCLSWSGCSVSLKAESIKLIKFSGISVCDTGSSKPPSKAPCHHFAPLVFNHHAIGQQTANLKRQGRGPSKGAKTKDDRLIMGG